MAIQEVVEVVTGTMVVATTRVDITREMTTTGQRVATVVTGETTTIVTETVASREAGDHQGVEIEEVQEVVSLGAVPVAVATEVIGVTPEASDDQTLTNNKRHNITLTTFTMAYSETDVLGSL